jgi:pilus assembly protein CpaF
LTASVAVDASTTHIDDLDPLVEIERRVQSRAKQLALDLSGPDGEHDLLALVRDEIDRWSDDAKRGLRPFELADPDAVADRAFRNVARYGPLTPLLDDPDVWEIMINAPDVILVRRHVGPSGYHDEVFHDDEHVARTLTKLLDDASTSHRKLDPSEGLQDAQLDDGSRLHIVHADVTRGGHLVVNIRRFTGVAFHSLAELVDREMLPAPAAAFLAAAVRADLSIVFAGSPGSGKTTLLSCCAGELDPAKRVVIAEEVFEAEVPLVNVASLQTRAARADRPAIDLRRLVSGFLRMAPDVAIVGEVRDKEALPLLLTLSSGVKGFTTIHAGSARQALTRLRFICQLSDAVDQIPMAALNSLVSEAVDLVVHCRRTTRGPQVHEIVAVEEQTSGPEATQFTVTEVFARAGATDELRWTGQLPVRAGRAFAEAGHDLSALLGAGGSTSWVAF